MDNADKPQKAQDKILIVDDSIDNRRLLSFQLKKEGYQLIEAGGGQAGLEKAFANQPDIILLDVMMPDLNGYEVCKRLKQHEATRLTPVIMLTALRDSEYRIKGIEAGADEFLSRPHVREELLVRVRSLINLKRARANLEEERNRLRLLYNLSSAINGHVELKETMSKIITETQEALGATKGNIMLVDRDESVTQKFIIRAGSQLEISDRVTQEVMSRGLGGWLVAHNQGDIIADITNDDRWVTLPNHQQETGSAIGVPLSSPNGVVGILILNHPEISYFTQDHLTLLKAIAAQAAVAIERATLYTEASEERSNLESILSQSTNAIITTDELGVISRVNQSAEAFFSLKSDELKKRSIYQVPQLQEIVPLFEQASTMPQSEEISLTGRNKTLHASVSPIQGVGYAIVMQDVTEIKRMEEMRLEQERKEKQRVTQTFSSYMGPRLVNHVLSNEPGLMARRELRKAAVVMFADIRNWTGGMITKVSPDIAIQQLNEFFTEMMDIALENDGTVFELTGDQLLVGFNAPFDQKNAPGLAVKTAVTMQERFDDLRVGWYNRVGTEIGLGIGINLGDVVMGNVGAETRMSFRMVGEAMNKAARLVDLADDSHIVISEEVHLALLEMGFGDELTHISFTPMQPASLKGIQGFQQLYMTQIKRTLLS